MYVKDSACIIYLGKIRIFFPNFFIFVSASGRSLENALAEESLKAPNSNDGQLQGSDKAGSTPTADAPDGNAKPEAKETALSARRRALFEPLEPVNGRGIRAEDLLPPPDFDSTSYPKGWLVGKKRKLVNVDVVESMRRIAVQEMNRKVCVCFVGITLH